MRPITILLSLALTFSYAPTHAGMSERAHDTNATLELIATFVGGSYDNSTQIAAQEMAGLAPDTRGTPIHQVITPIKIAGFSGLQYFFQLGASKSTESIFSTGFYQFHTVSGLPLMTMYMFDDVNRFKNTHLTPEIFKAVTLNDVHTTKGCEFYLSVDTAKTQVKGEMKEDACFPTDRRTGKAMRHQDVLVIKDGEFWNDPAFYDLDNTVLMKNMSGDYQKQIRYAK